MLDELATDDAIMTWDSGDDRDVVGEALSRYAGTKQYYLSGNLATMAPGLPYAIGIQHAYPDRQVIAYVGDGGLPDRAGRDRAPPRAPGSGIGQGRHPRGRRPWPAGLSLTSD